ncbi:MAG: hypothetical protein NC191_06330 [Muribaculaceae bacterium]|nr:hypothetical protein [Muribaculaceae bacterium]
MMKISELMIKNVNVNEDCNQDIFSDVCTVGEFLEKYGKNYRTEIDEEAFKEQLDYLENMLI